LFQLKRLSIKHAAGKMVKPVADGKHLHFGRYVMFNGLMIVSEDEIINLFRFQNLFAVVC
jgi:hypothetical protein